MLTASLQKEPNQLAALSAAQDAMRLKLAAQSASTAIFDWNVAEGTITWDGAVDILPFHLDCSRAQIFVDSIDKEKRGPLENILDGRARQPSQFQVDLEIASAMGSVCFTLAGTRLPGHDGRTERLIGLMRETTERAREMQRLKYLATRDELTGQLNRNALREELAQAIESAKSENRHCAFLVASIDRLAMINDSFGIDAGEEVIVGIGERLSRALRGGDIIGRTAGNKFGVLLKNCSEREIHVVSARLRSAVRGQRESKPAPAWYRPPRRWEQCGCPRPPAIARKPCCAPSRRWTRPAPMAAMALPSMKRGRSAKPRGCAG